MATSTPLGALESALRAELPSGSLHEADDRYSIDGVEPALVVTPASEAEASTALQIADAAGAAVIAIGTRRHLGIGMPPARYDVALDLSRLDRVVEYSPADLTVTVQAGTRLTTLQETLAANGQWLPLDPPSDGSIGGLLAVNRSGPARMTHGGARDLVIGMRALLADGRAVKSGGRVVKNVAGYDMAKLHIGSLGTLAVIVEVAFKVAPLPAVNETIGVAGPLATLMSIAIQARNRGLAVNGVSLRGSSAGWHMAVRLAGGSAAVARSRRDLHSLASGLELLAPPPALDNDIDGQVTIRCSVPPTSVVAVCEQLAQAGAQVVAYPTVGTVRAAWPEAPAFETLQRLRWLALEHRGALVVEAAPVEVKQRFDVWGPPGQDFVLMRRLKEQLDPNATLSPGRFLGGL